MNMRRRLFISILLVLLYVVPSYCDVISNKSVIIPRNANIVLLDSNYNRISDEVKTGDIYKIVGIVSSEVSGKLFYIIDLNGNNALVNTPYVGVINENINDNIDKLKNNQAKYWQLLKDINSVDDLKLEFMQLKDSLTTWDYFSPIEYEAIKLEYIMRKNFEMSIREKKISNYSSFYKDIKAYILSLIEDKNITINSAVASHLLVSLIVYDPMVFSSNNSDNNMAIAKMAYDLKQNTESADIFIRELSTYSKTDYESVISAIMRNMTDSSSNYANIGDYYCNIGNYDEAIAYFKIAIIKSEGKEHKFIHRYAKTRLANAYGKINDYENAANEYLTLEYEYGGFAFQAAWHADQARNNGVSINGIDIYSIIELYKKSNDPNGIFNAGKLYYEIKSPRNVRLMANILKDKYRQYESANILFDDADRLEAQLKGHNP